MLPRFFDLFCLESSVGSILLSRRLIHRYHHAFQKTPYGFCALFLFLLPFFQLFCKLLFLCGKASISLRTLSIVFLFSAVSATFSRESRISSSLSKELRFPLSGAADFPFMKLSFCWDADASRRILSISLKSPLRPFSSPPAPSAGPSKRFQLFLIPFGCFSSCVILCYLPACLSKTISLLTFSRSWYNRRADLLFSPAVQCSTWLYSAEWIVPEILPQRRHSTRISFLLLRLSSWTGRILIIPGCQFLLPSFSSSRSQYDAQEDCCCSLKAPPVRNRLTYDFSSNVTIRMSVFGNGNSDRYDPPPALCQKISDQTVIFLLCSYQATGKTNSSRSVQSTSD